MKTLRCSSARTARLRIWTIALRHCNSKLSKILGTIFGRSFWALTPSPLRKLGLKALAAARLATVVLLAKDLHLSASVAATEEDESRHN